MKVLSFLMLLTFCSIHSNVRALDYFHYQKLVNSLDDKIIESKYEETISTLDSIYNNFNFVYARHCVKALQICLRVRDEERSALWLNKAVLAGVPQWYLKQLTSLRAIHYIPSCKLILKQYDSLHQIYLKRINRKLADYIDSLYDIDQFRTKRVNDGFAPLRISIYGLQWINNNKRQWKLLQQVMTTYGFPGEQLLGLPKMFEDTSVMFKNNVYRFNQLDAYQTYIMLIHCYSRKTKSINDLLYRAVKLGQMPAYQYAAINDFMAEYGYKAYSRNYFNQWHTTKDSTMFNDIMIRRREIGLNTLEQKHKNEQVSAGRRKAKTYYEEVFLE
ncbi:MAG: hypothetical protein JNM67_10405 [Bacteroidetes bacterium]|nr:hypothetical protein [Bacteroidota bacterium]